MCVFFFLIWFFATNSCCVSSAWLYHLIKISLPVFFSSFRAIVCFMCHVSLVLCCSLQSSFCLYIKFCGDLEFAFRSWLVHFYLFYLFCVTVQRSLWLLCRVCLQNVLFVRVFVLLYGLLYSFYISLLPIIRSARPSPFCVSVFYFYLIFHVFNLFMGSEW